VSASPRNGVSAGAGKRIHPLSPNADTLTCRHAETFPLPPSISENFAEKWGGPAFFVLRKLLRRTCSHDFSTGIPGFGTDIQDIVGLCDDIEVMLDEDHRVSLVDQAV
jgi:hypothetical protein